MSRYRRPATAIVLTMSLAGFTVAAAGCSLASPKVIATPYTAADGANADLPVGDHGSVQLRNFLLVSSAKGKPGVLVGAVTTDGADPVQLQVAVVDPTGNSVLGQTSITARPGELTQIGPAGTAAVQVPNVPLPPGSTLTVHVQAGSGGRDFAVPVLAPQNQYASITPGPSGSAGS